MTPENDKAAEFSVTTFMCEGVKSRSKMAESFNYRRPLSWEKSRAAKRLIVFESPSEGRKWVNGRDNWAADSWVGYGLLCFSTAEKGRRPGGEGGEKEKGRKRRERPVLCDAAAGVVWPFLGRGELQSCLTREVTLGPSHTPACTRCKPSLLAAHAHTAS